MSTPKGTFFDLADQEIAGLAGVEEIGSISWNRVARQFRSLSAFLAAPRDALGQILSEKQLSGLKNRRQSITLPKSIKLLKLGDIAYPALLKEIPDPPLWLFIVGNPAVLSAQMLSVVGSRKHTAYAIQAIDQIFTKELLKNITIVSGLAYGIDKLAHQASVEAGGKTVAVLAGGLDKIYPEAHRQLAEKIIKIGGAIVSEYPPGSPAWPTKFPVRNRIIAGLSSATVVVEAALKSGTMTTAKSTVDYNRDLFAVPGDITRSTSEGCNFLIAQGATPLISANQLANYFGFAPTNPEPLLDLQSQPLVDLLSRQSARIDQIVADTGQSVEVVLQQLTELELAGVVYQVRPGYYQIKKYG